MLVNPFKENKILRELLWRMHGHDSLFYNDDGEIGCMECCKQYGFSDWKRTPASKIADMILRANVREINKPDDDVQTGNRVQTDKDSLTVGLNAL